MQSSVRTFFFYFHSECVNASALRSPSTHTTAQVYTMTTEREQPFSIGKTF